MSLSKHVVSDVPITYTAVMSKLWNETIETHCREVREAILEDGSS
jgi:hypothetical protein